MAFLVTSDWSAAKYRYGLQAHSPKRDSAAQTVVLVLKDFIKKSLVNVPYFKLFVRNLHKNIHI